MKKFWAAVAFFVGFLVVDGVLTRRASQPVEICAAGSWLLPSGTIVTSGAIKDVCRDLADGNR